MAAAVRPPAVAGTFYPGSPAELRSTVAALLREAESREDPARPAPKAVIAPHAGYVYSGPIAAVAFRALAPAAPAVSKVVLLGPAHYVPIRGLALPAAQVLWLFRWQ
jgi:MEMO1 family protein